MSPETIPTFNEAISKLAPIATHHKANDNPIFVTIEKFNELKDMVFSMSTMIKSSASDHPVTEPVQHYLLLFLF